MKKPAHIAIIMDGNGRWAKKRMLPRHLGHKAGADSLHKLIQKMEEVGGFEQLTVFAFSTENWNRPEKEVDGLMNLLREYIKKFISDAATENLRLGVLGRKDRLPKDILADILYMEETTKDKTGLQVNMAIDYGGRDEILRMTQGIINAYEQGKIKPASITEETIAHYLDTKNQQDPDLLIRTSGEKRISNFLLWQLAYTELYFTDILWPDFNYQALEHAIDSYNERQRRFGR